MKKIFITLLFVLLSCNFAFAGSKVFTVLTNVSTSGASDGFTVKNFQDKTIYIIASGITSGATVLTQTSPDESNWATIDSTDITANGVTEIAINGFSHMYLRVNISSYTDGTYTVYLVARD